MYNDFFFSIIERNEKQKIPTDKWQGLLDANYTNVLILRQQPCCLSQSVLLYTCPLFPVL